MIKLNQIRKVAEPPLISMGYRAFPDENWGTIYCKVIGNGLFLSLAIEKSNLYDYRWTASMQIGTTSFLGSTFNDIPHRSYVRVYSLLDESERYSSGLFQNCGYWWQDIDTCSISGFIHAVTLTEERLCGNKDLIRGILSSVTSRELHDQSSQIIDTYYSDNQLESYSFRPEKERRGVPIRWFEAAEIVVKKVLKWKLTRYVVIHLAETAYREDTLTKASGKHMVKMK